MHDIAEAALKVRRQTPTLLRASHLLNGYLHAAGAERHRLEDYTYLEL